MRHFKAEIWCGIGAIALGLSLPAIANVSALDQTHSHQQMMERLDTNHDGKVSPAEWQAATDQRFSRMDTNGDGFITQAEMAVAREVRAARRHEKNSAALFARADTNNDGKLSRAEYEIAAQKMYKHMMSHQSRVNGGTADAPPSDQE